MKLGVLLPTFRSTPNDALEFAREAQDAGLDGVFAYDHLWPMGQRERPALAPLPVLARVSTLCSDLVVGTLVSRIGLYGAQKVIEQFNTLADIAPERVICGLGLGDKLSKEENDAYGIAVAPIEERTRELADVASSLRARMPVWLGAGSHVTPELARKLQVTLNYWQVVPEVSESVEWTWAGNADDDVSRQLDELDERGAQWAVFTPSVKISQLKEWRSH